jgi:hypothetical protein
MDTLTDLVTGTENNVLVWLDYSPPIPDSYYVVFGHFRADVSPDGVTLKKHDVLVEDADTDFKTLMDAIVAQRAALKLEAKTEVGAWVTGRMTAKVNEALAIQAAIDAANKPPVVEKPPIEEEPIVPPEEPVVPPEEEP